MSHLQGQQDHFNQIGNLYGLSTKFHKFVANLSVICATVYDQLIGLALGVVTNDKFHQALPQSLFVGEIIWGEQLALQDTKPNLNLI